MRDHFERTVRATLLASLVLVGSGCSSSDSTGPGNLFDLTLALQGMTEHVGQRFQVRVIDLTTGQEAGRATVAAIPGANFTVSVPDVFVLLDDFNVDFYADHDMDGSYDAPPTDHAWRITINDPTTDILLTFTHDANYTDIMFP